MNYAKATKFHNAKKFDNEKSGCIILNMTNQPGKQLMKMLPPPRT